MAMARGFPNHGVSSDGGSGSQYTTPSYSSFPISDSFYQASMSRGTIGDVFFGTDDMKDTRDLVYKGDVLESYQRETAVKYLRRRRSKKERISNFGLNKVAAIETSFPIEAVGCESGSIDIFSVELAIGNVDGNVESSSIDTISTELAVGNVVAGNVSNVFVNVELVAGVVKASIALSVGVPYVMPYQSIHALPVASTEVMELTKTAREVFKGLLI
ncbi:hypothetical protein V6N11_068346 [Hibiscus sabdariffa]|uniref:Uncharacterized protein n=1 Tax=Hibiscus sabdariffa TaxID=183260 RepID=A0ABR1ZM38_9ROSI